MPVVFIIRRSRAFSKMRRNDDTWSSGLNSEPSGGEELPVPPKKAGLLQVGATIFWAMLMIGRKGTWEKNGAVVSMPQMVVGALAGGVVVVLILLALVRLALS